MKRETKVVPSVCDLCMASCGVLVHMENGKPVKVEGDPDYPVNKGVLCPIGEASLEFLYHPDRLKYPLKRIGKRGSGKWQKISWDEALDTIAEELTKGKQKYGPESVFIVRGGAKGYQDQYLGRFANVFGTPNIASTASYCHVPRVAASETTCGFMTWPDYEYPPACMLVWGVNSSVSYLPTRLRELGALNKGAKLIVIDPIETVYSREADLWVKIRPSSDLALALAMINVVINEKLYDEDFVEQWTVGFDKLKNHIQQYTPEWASEITWVPSETIREIARVYATNSPAIISLGNGIDHSINNYQCGRAVSILRAITGNIGKPGGEIRWSPSGIVGRGSPDLNQQNALPAEVRAKRISAKDGILPRFYYALPHGLKTAILESKPYPVRAGFFGGANWLQTYSGVVELRQALEKLDFMVVSDFFLNPIADIADIVLPVATYLEKDNVQESQATPIVGVMQKVAQVGEAWSDYEILKEIAKRMGLGQYFWETEKEALDYLLKPVGITFDEFREIRMLSGRKQYRHYEKDGFKTPSGKIELYSEKLEESGFDPLPVYHEPPESPFSDPELAKEYPLILTNNKIPVYKHSMCRQIKSLRENHPDPLVTIHSDVADKLGIAEGDWVFIENKRGRIKHKAILSNSIDPRIVLVEYGWWFPEKKDQELHAWAESNINVLTSDKPPFSRETGGVTFRGILCKVYKAE